MPLYFAGREKAKALFFEKLQFTISKIPRHMAVVGDPGSGKTTLLSILEDGAKKEKCFTSTQLVGRDLSITEFADSLFRRILNSIRLDKGDKAFYSALKRLTELRDLDNVYSEALGSSGGSNTDPQFFLTEGLYAIFSKLDVPASVLFLDDIDLAADYGKLLITLRNSLMELSKRGVKLMVVVSGGVGILDEFSDTQAQALRFFEPYVLENLSPDEAELAITKPLGGTGVVFDDEVISEIIRKTGGHPYYIQEFCFHLFKNARQGKVTLRVLDASLDDIFLSLERKIFEVRYKNVGDSELMTFAALEGKDEVAFSELVEESKKRFGISRDSVWGSLRRLTVKGLVRKAQRGKYSIVDPLFAEYVRLASSRSGRLKL